MNITNNLYAVLTILSISTISLDINSSNKEVTF